MNTRTFIIPVTAPATTALGLAVQALDAQIAGGGSRWYEMTTPAGMATYLNVGGVSGTILPYCNKAAWNPVGNTVEVIGADHNQAGGPWHVRYSESSNTFASGPVAQPGFAGHGFDHYAVNPYTGDLYWKDYAGGPLSRLANGASTWTTVATTFPSGLAGNITYGCDWVNAGFYGTGAQGGLAIFSSYSDNIYIYDPLSGWRPTITGPGTANSYHGTIQYSSIKNVAVFGGKNTTPSRIWRLTSAGVVTELTACPASWGITRGQMVADPVSGNFLMSQRNGFYEFNPDGVGTWTTLTGTRARPAGVSTNNLDGNGAPGVAMVSLPEHGVIAVFSPKGSTSASFHIYKH